MTNNQPAKARPTTPGDSGHLKSSTMEQFIASINIYDYERFRDRVVKECNISRATWSNWINGKGIERKYKPIIDRVATEMFGSPVFGKGGEK